MPIFTEAVFIGHASVILRSPDFVLAIDPWLGGNPACPENWKAPKQIDLIVITHGHGDHAADAVQLGNKHNCPVIATNELAMALVDDGLNKDLVVGMNKGGTTTQKGIRISLTHALHSSSYQGKQGRVYAGEACGAVIRDDHQAFYHTGDTCLFSDISLIKDRHHPTYAFLCAGDHFTMGPEEAAQAAHLAGVAHAIPIHHGTFPAVTIDPAIFEAKCREYGITPHVMKPGEVLNLE